MKQISKNQLVLVSGGAPAPDADAVCAKTGKNLVVGSVVISDSTFEVKIGITGGIGDASGIPKIEAKADGSFTWKSGGTVITCVPKKTADGSDYSGYDYYASSDFGGGDLYAGGYEGGYEGGGGGGCVQVDSLLPDGTKAGDIVVGAVMQLSDEASLSPAVGTVTFSQRKKAPGFRITTISGITLVCSDTAPIPTPQGLVLAPELGGKSVAVRRDEGGATHSAWEAVKSVEAIGEIEVQHITVGDKCFWAGEKANGYILHHNLKQEGGSGYEYGYDEYYDDYC